MVDQSRSPSNGGQIVVTEKARLVNLLWGFLAVMSALALVRGHLGAETTTGRIVGDVIFGTLLVGSVWMWLWSRRYPSRLEISPETITYTYRGAGNPTTLFRNGGDLYVHTTWMGGRHPTTLRYLKVTGSDEGILLQTFDWPEVERACMANGWRFVEGPSS